MLFNDVCTYPPEGSCASGYHDGGDGTCVPEGSCASGYHDGGDGTCVLEGDCVLGYRLDGADCAQALMLWTKLGSEEEITIPEFGPNGTFLGGSFMAGQYGDAFVVDYDEPQMVRYPYTVIPAGAGTIELWFKAIGFPTNLAWGENPTLFRGTTFDGYKLHLNGNDGAAHSGICYAFGSGLNGGSSYYTTSWTYENLLGGVDDWHHIALVWDEDGVPDVQNHKAAVFLDGTLDSTRFDDDGTFETPADGEFYLMSEQNLDQGSVAFDNLKIWNYAKKDFSDRFQEWVDP